MEDPFRFQRRAMVAAGISIAAASVVFAMWSIVAYAVVASSGHANHDWVSTGYASAVLGNAACVSLIWLSTRLG
jgi:hypothetical protein